MTAHRTSRADHGRSALVLASPFSRDIQNLRPPAAPPTAQSPATDSRSPRPPGPMASPINPRPIAPPPTSSTQMRPSPRRSTSSRGRPLALPERPVSVLKVAFARFGHWSSLTGSARHRRQSAGLPARRSRSNDGDERRSFKRLAASDLSAPIRSPDACRHAWRSRTRRSTTRVTRASPGEGTTTHRRHTEPTCLSDGVDGYESHIAPGRDCVQIATDMSNTNCHRLR